MKMRLETAFESLFKAHLYFPEDYFAAESVAPFVLSI